MTAPYKKRAKSGYNTDKTISNRSERKFEETEIKEQLSDETKVGPKPAKPKVSNFEKSIKKELSDLKWAIKGTRGLGLENLIKRNQGDYFSSHYHELYRRAKLAIPVLEKALDNPECSSKVKKLIKDLLQKV